MTLPLVINPPGVEPVPRGRLLDAIPTIVPHGAINGDREVEERWAVAGVTWQPEPCQALFSMDVNVCARIDHTDIPHVCEAAITQTAFSVYEAFYGSALEYSPEALAAIALSRITVKLSAAFATELITANISGANGLALSKSATQPPALTFGTTAPLYRALPILENELAARLRGGKGIIHMPPGMLEQAVYQCEVELNADGVFETPVGNLVVADAGYVNMAKPVGSATAGTPGTTDWVYASGMVRYAKSGIISVDGGNIGSSLTNYTGRENLTGIDPAQSSFKSRDAMIRYFDVLGILIFDPCPVTAALVTYSENS